jgi:hypothetical protein
MRFIGRRVGRRAMAVVALLAIAAGMTVVAAQATTRGSDGATEASNGSSVAGALPKIAPKVFSGDVRDLPQVATRARLKPDLVEPEGFKQAPSHAAPRTPNLRLGQMPSPTQNYPGLSRTDACTGGQCGGGIPPDTNGDVGPVYYIQAVNTAYGVFDKLTGTRLAAFTENALFSGTGSFCDGNGGGDPVVVYDAISDRWILTHLAYGPGATTGPFYQCIAVSRSGDPLTGGWYLYSIRMDQGLVPVNTLNDYPKFGIWNDCFYFSFNGFQMPSGNYNGTGFGSFSRSDMYSGATLTGALGFLAGTGPDAFTMIPANLAAPGAAGMPPAGRHEFFVSESIASFLWKVRTFTPGANCGGGGALSAATSIGQAPYSQPGADILQPPPATGLNTLDSVGDRVMQKVQYRRVGGAESLWVVHTTRTGSADQPQWAQLNVTGGTIATAPAQQQIYAPDGTLNRWMGSIAADTNGNVALGYSTSNTASFPSIAYSGRLAADPANALPQGETLLVAGGGSQTNDCGGTICHRWGDYSSMSVDPIDGCTFWFTSEYYIDQTGGSAGAWNTRIGSFKFPQCTAVPPPPPPPPLPGCTVPKVTGLLLTKAVRKLTHAHCRRGKVRRVFSTRKRKNHVLAQNPRRGRKLRRGAKVNLTVGKGPRRR